jgi:phosphorylcholine metabolism protein LicD
MLLNLQDNHQNNLQAKKEKEIEIKKNLKTIDRPLVDPVSDKLSQKQFMDRSLLDRKRFLKKMERLGDQNKLTLDDQKQAFALGWESYPEKIGKKIAWGHFRKTVTTKGDYNRIIDAYNYYDQYVYWKNGKGLDLEFQHGSRWFGEWRDWAIKSETDPQTWEQKRYKL